MYVVHNTYPTLVRRYHVHTYLVHPTLKPRHFLLRCRLLLPYRFFFHTKTKISWTHCRRLLLYRLLLRYRRYSFLGGNVSIRNSLRSNYTIRALVVRIPVSSLSFQVQHTWYIRPGRRAHEPGTSSASCCCNGSVGWIVTHVSDPYVEVSVGAHAL